MGGTARMTERKLKPTRVIKAQTIIVRQVIMLPPCPSGGCECLAIDFPILAFDVRAYVPNYITLHFF